MSETDRLADQDVDPLPGLRRFAETASRMASLEDSEEHQGIQEARTDRRTDQDDDQGEENLDAGISDCGERSREGPGPFRGRGGHFTALLDSTVTRTKGTQFDVPLLP